MTAHLAKYCQYIANTACDPLPVAMFDEDWEPIGAMVRADMIAAGLAVEAPNGIKLTDQGRQLSS
jgi:hypothetical protein